MKGQQFYTIKQTKYFKEPPVERKASPIEKMMTQTMLISPDKIEFDDNDDIRVDNEDVKRIRDSDEEDMFTATPEELPIHRFVLVFSSAAGTFTQSAW